MSKWTTSMAGTTNAMPSHAAPRCSATWKRAPFRMVEDHVSEPRKVEEPHEQNGVAPACPKRDQRDPGEQRGNGVPDRGLAGHRRRKGGVDDLGHEEGDSNVPKQLREQKDRKRCGLGLGLQPRSDEPPANGGIGSEARQKLESEELNDLGQRASRGRLPAAQRMAAELQPRVMLPRSVSASALAWLKPRPSASAARWAAGLSDGPRGDPISTTATTCRVSSSE